MEDLGPWTLDFGLWTLDLGPWTLDFGLWTPNPRPSPHVEIWDTHVENWYIDVEIWDMKRAHSLSMLDAETDATY